MPSFKDSHSREWTIKIDAPLVKEVREAIDFDLLADDAFAKLTQDDVLLVDVLWLCCKRDAGQTTDIEFAKAIATGEAIEAACDCLMQARRDFFRPRKRSLLRSLEEQQAAILSEGMGKAEAKIGNPELRKALMTRLETEMEAAIQKILTGPTSATNTPAAVESAPTA